MSTEKNEPWSQEQLDNWYKTKPVIPSRNYTETIVPRIEALEGRDDLKVETYGSATYETYFKGMASSTTTHDLFRIIVGDLNPEKPTYFIVGGTHGYEKGGPLAALKFAEEETAQYADTCNIVIYPCIAPGPYEKEQRFTQGRIDPNRDALSGQAQSEEMAAFTKSVEELRKTMFGTDLTKEFTAAIDLHETPHMDIAINVENAIVGGGDMIPIDESFPEGFFMVVANDKANIGPQIINAVRNDGHLIVGGPEIYNVPNHDGLIYMDERLPIKGTVSQFMADYSKACFTTEYCDEYLTDDKPNSEQERVDPQMAAIRGMLPSLTRR